MNMGAFHFNQDVIEIFKFHPKRKLQLERKILSPSKFVER